MIYFLLSLIRVSLALQGTINCLIAILPQPTLLLTKPDPCTYLCSVAPSLQTLWHHAFKRDMVAPLEAAGDVRSLSALTVYPARPDSQQACERGLFNPGFQGRGCSGWILAAPGSDPCGSFRLQQGQASGRGVLPLAPTSSAASETAAAIRRARRCRFPEGRLYALPRA